ncbi:DNA polymerase epsilon subunit 3 [Phlyctochytrium planicorne]|nr:DNA polymerase epsilon subunit 3 [Phlyctochytrium planicorne]
MATIDDLGMPKAITTRVMKNAIPATGQIQKDAKSAMTRACTVYISYITTLANEITKKNNHKTVSASDVYEAIQKAGFGNLIPRLRKDMEAYTQSVKEKKLKRKSGDVTDLQTDDYDIPEADNDPEPESAGADGSMEMET